MPVFDFANDEKTDGQAIKTYTTFRSNETKATSQKPILVLKDSKGLLIHHVNGCFTNPSVRTSFEAELESGTISFDIDKIDLSYKNIGNEGIKIFENLNFGKLNDLNLTNNGISDISSLKYLNSLNLEKLNLENNAISEIEVLKNENFNKLKYLDLSNNHLSNLNALKEVKFIHLKFLNLNKTNIGDKLIDLEGCNFEDLENLNLSMNQISDVKVLKDVNLTNIFEKGVSGKDNHLVTKH